MDPDSLPAIVALFLVIFDTKVGYTIAWHRSLPEIDLDGLEFRCLPSGLHGVKDDVVAFLQDAHPGISAFVQDEAGAESRNASFATVGVLVQSSEHPLGRGWLHIPELKNLAERVVSNTKDTSALDQYWQRHKLEDISWTSATSGGHVAAIPPPDSRREHERSEVSEGLLSEGDIGLEHPALCMPDVLDTFGPLVFPLFRAAMLRKRVLLLGQPPVRPMWNFVWVLSILARIPQTSIPRIASDGPLDPQALFSIGISDIANLSSMKGSRGWIACTTDEILRDKHKLYDILVTMPGTASVSARPRGPTVMTSSGMPIRATQRDLRRYRLLCNELGRMHLERQRYGDEPSQVADDDSGDDTAPLVSTITNLNTTQQPLPYDEALVVEPVSWTRMTYNSFLWWASAGEMEAWESEEIEADSVLLDDLPEIEGLKPRMGSPGVVPLNGDNAEVMKSQDKEHATAAVVVAYFHRLAEQILRTMSSIVERTDLEEDDNAASRPIELSSADIQMTGLDAWSLDDRAFLEQAMRLWFDREGIMKKEGMRVCGIRVC